MSHTPAPWEVCSGGSNLRTGKYVLTEWFVRRPDDDIAIAADIIDPETGEPSEANARLIAAAPDLLSALKAMIDEHEPLTSSACDLQRKVLELIDKVEGESA